MRAYNNEILPQDGWKRFSHLQDFCNSEWYPLLSRMGPQKKYLEILSGSPTHLLLEVTFMVVGEPDYWILCPTEERSRGRYCGDFRCYWVILC